MMTDSSNQAKTDPPRGLMAWVDALAEKPFPLMQPTVSAMQAIDESEGSSIDRLCDSMLHDPGAILNILRKVGGMPRGRLSSDVTSLEGAAMLIGFSSVRQMASSMEVLDNVDASEQIRGYLQVTSRAFHAAYQAYDWALRRADMMPKEAFVAAFMHDIGKMAMWLHGGKEMQQIKELRLREKMPFDEAQYVVLGFSLEQLSLELAKRWRLSEMIIDVLTPDMACNHRIYSVMLACQLARLADENWYSSEMQACLEHIATYLGLDYSATVHLVHLNAVDAARETAYYGAIPAANLLPLIPVPEVEDDVAEPRHFCLTPQHDVYEQVVSEIQANGEAINLNELMGLVMKGLHDGLGLNRSVFAMLSQDRSSVRARYLSGTDNDPEFSQFELLLEPTNLFTHLMKKQQSVWISDTNRDKFWKLIPDAFKELIKTDAFYASSVFINDKPIGLFYSDRHITDCHLDEDSYQHFKSLVHLAGATLEKQRATRE
ncbi:MAG: HDOD domain-containing protein [Sulfuriflexus sp.]|nr:HDOD domain-containing protein [Sulfuriflexus sp.]